jgi:hypothetical protein
MLAAPAPPPTLTPVTTIDSTARPWPTGNRAHRGAWVRRKAAFGRAARRRPACGAGRRAAHDAIRLDLRRGMRPAAGPQQQHESDAIRSRRHHPQPPRTLSAHPARLHHRRERPAAAPPRLRRRRGRGGAAGRDRAAGLGCSPRLSRCRACVSGPVLASRALRRLGGHWRCGERGNDGARASRWGRRVDLRALSRAGPGPRTHRLGRQARGLARGGSTGRHCRPARN